MPTKTVITEHEQLKQICDLIGYQWIKEYAYIDKKWFYRADEFLDRWARRVDVREIIFQPEFMNKMIKWIYKIRHFSEWELETQAEDDFSQITEHLDNPTQYLYNLLWLWLKQ